MRASRRRLWAPSSTPVSVMLSVLVGCAQLTESPGGPDAEAPGVESRLDGESSPDAINPEANEYPDAKSIPNAKSRPSRESEKPKRRTRSIEELMAMLNAEKKHVPHRAIMELRKTGKAGASVLAGVLEADTRPFMRRLALWTLQGMEGDQIAPIANALSRDSDAGVREDAARSLGYLGYGEFKKTGTGFNQLTRAGPEALAIRRGALFRAATVDTEASVRRVALEVLCELEEPMPLSLLTDLLAQIRKPSPDPLLRVAALNVLEHSGLAGERVAVETLAHTVFTSEQAVREAAARLLAQPQVGRSAVIYLAEQLQLAAERQHPGDADAGERERALRGTAYVFEFMGSKARLASPKLIASARAGCSPQARRAIAQALGSIGLSYGFTTRVFLHSELRAGNLGAAEALVRCGEEEDLSLVLTTDLGQAEGDVLSFLRTIARIRLKGGDDAQVRAALDRAVAGKSESVRELSCKMLAWWPGDAARKVTSRNRSLKGLASGFPRGTTPAVQWAATRTRWRLGLREKAQEPSWLRRKWVVRLRPRRRWFVEPHSH